MRKGENPSKDILLPELAASHRVIIPLYIPSEVDYYAEAFKIFEYCLFSLLKTSESDLKISVVSNNSCASVNRKLLALQEEGHIDELIIEKEGIGKINSILKALRTAEERFITITDADVMFCNGWEAAVLDVFRSFPKAGAVCPVPVFRTHLRLTSNIWRKYLFSGKMRFLPVKNPEAMTRFANSIGWPWLDEKYKDVILTLKARNGTIAVLGCSHFAATYKREVFSQLPKRGSKYQLGGDSEFLYTDEPVLRMGGYRLSTYDNYAYHLGNHAEPWMEEQFQELSHKSKKDTDYSAVAVLRRNPFDYYVSEQLFKKLFLFKNFYRFLLKRKGLSPHQIKNYIN